MNSNDPNLRTSESREKFWRELFGQLDMKNLIIAGSYLNEAMAYAEVNRDPQSKIPKPVIQG